MAAKIIVSGVIGNHPFAGGGNSWVRLQYILGLKKLGFKVYFFEHLLSSYEENWKPTSFEESFNLKYFREVMESFQLEDYCSLIYNQGEKHFGLSYGEAVKISKDADLLINISGRFHLKEILKGVKKRVYLDLDPGFTQIWYEQYNVDMNFKGHDLFFTIGRNIGKPHCPIPPCGIEWKGIMPPMVLDFWEPASENHFDSFTTVADWRGYSPICYKAEWYGQKSEEFKRFIALPVLSGQKMEIALNIHPDETEDLKMLRDNGWILKDPKICVQNPKKYQEYIRNSKAEFSVAKNGYVKGRTGWFSDRSACYLASGRPVVLQDTGFGDFLPVGKGLLTFKNMEDILEGIQEINSHYQAHSKDARQIAEDFLDSDKILRNMLREAGL